MQTALTLLQTWSKKERFAAIGGHGPRSQRHEQHCWTMSTPPESQRMLFVADEPPRMAWFDRARSYGRTPGGVTLPRLFLYSLVAARRSVQSMSATPSCSLGQCVNKRFSRCAFNARSTLGV